MAYVTIRILEGLERGREYQDLPTPITIGREEENDIQLNDDRVSRFHAKFQEDTTRVILTDLDSTNGTRVNGHPVNLRVVREGDLVSIGRCLLHVQKVRAQGLAQTALSPGNQRDLMSSDPTTLADGKEDAGPDDEGDFLAPPPGLAPEDVPLFPQGAPELPTSLKPLQRAQLSDMLAFVHEQLTHVLAHANEHTTDGEQRVMRCPWRDWQRLVELSNSLAQYLREMSDPS